MYATPRHIHTPEEIVGKLQQAARLLEQGTRIEATCQSLGIGPATLYRWRRRYGGMSLVQARRLFDFTCENRHLKSIIAQQQEQARVLRLIIEGKS